MTHICRTESKCKRFLPKWDNDGHGGRNGTYKAPCSYPRHQVYLCNEWKFGFREKKEWDYLENTIEKESLQCI